MDRNCPSRTSRRCACAPWRRRVLLVCAWAVTAVLLSNCALAWPQFLYLRRREELPAAVQADADDARAHTPPRLFPGAMERGEQARMLWEEAEAKGRLSPCWKRSLQLLHAKCAEVRNEDTMRSRLALFMATCDANSDGRAHPSFHCGSAATQPSELSAHAVRQCVQGLSDSAYAAFLQYRLHADVLCAYLEEELYQQRTEAAVAAMHLQMQRSSHMLTALQHSGAEVVALMKDSQTLQQESREAASSLLHQLGLLHNGQAAALQSLQQAVSAILRTSSHTDAALGELHTRVQGAAAEALASVQALSQETFKRFAEVEAQTRGVVRLMQQMDALHQLLARQRLPRHRMAWVLGCLCGVLALTCLPQTAAARLPATLLTVVGCAGVPLLRWWTGRARWLFLHETAWESLCLSLAVGLVGYCAHRHTPSDTCRRRRLAREEAIRLCGELQLQQQLGGAMLQPYAPQIPILGLQPHPCMVRSDAPEASLSVAHAWPPLSIVVSPRDDEVEATSTTADGSHCTASNEGSLSLPDEVSSAASTPNRKRGRPFTAGDDAARHHATARTRRSTARSTCRTTRRKG
ncbi:conserved hypothetical protein [Leishmania infantum JPCM5]|uniref:Uncharacterized protein n=3 Tax=Leishmania donovani species complex TaxID=38574 RepID=A4HS06_LEIIN|nr:conserved hypothetical protein [Leishmania infantum JPCM5]XP_003858074.1 hypothetical protein, conserved [Leishmania donovani]CAC9440496.1 hypothetical_protein_-_conserved [Leishmania infantum]AYU75786.1 hypothetical protein LdCL_040006200 [Leishmania donovani]CAM65034.1 conserved hypothetical protein [Leishmania infantum JPCM5]CBZ31350.1 hypothetical protein, conserved [Leishmania donovani]SUZ38806.1 hypothetical_protein_-_conserved [Leishmania infantum]|eukprot:XP_001462848.1 conserved hypothetical protein [Leishmania infantum JPCM5]